MLTLLQESMENEICLIIRTVTLLSVGLLLGLEGENTSKKDIIGTFHLSRYCRPVGSGKTALTLALCRRLRSEYNIAVTTNDIFTREDQEFLLRNEALPSDRIRAIETGGCPHAAIREDISANMGSLEELTAQFGCQVRHLKFIDPIYLIHEICSCYSSKVEAIILPQIILESSQTTLYTLLTLACQSFRTI
jgi:hypothetical protein